MYFWNISKFSSPESIVLFSMHRSGSPRNSVVHNRRGKVSVSGEVLEQIQAYYRKSIAQLLELVAVSWHKFRSSYRCCMDGNLYVDQTIGQSKFEVTLGAIKTTREFIKICRNIHSNLREWDPKHKFIRSVQASFFFCPISTLGLPKFSSPLFSVEHNLQCLVSEIYFEVF